MAVSIGSDAQPESALSSSIHHRGSATSYPPHGVNLENALSEFPEIIIILVAGLWDKDADCMHAGGLLVELTGDSRHAETN